MQGVEVFHVMQHGKGEGNDCQRQEQCYKNSRGPEHPFPALDFPYGGLNGTSWERAHGRAHPRVFVRAQPGWESVRRVLSAALRKAGSDIRIPPRRGPAGEGNGNTLSRPTDP